MSSRLPPLAPVPPLRLRIELAPEEWEACLHAWITLGQLHLRSADENFWSSAADEDGPLVPFLTSYFREAALAGKTDIHFGHPDVAKLSKLSFRFCQRILLADKPAWPLLHWTFLAHVAQCFPRSEAVIQLLRTVYQKHQASIEQELQKSKNHLTNVLDSAKPDGAETELHTLVYLINASPQVGDFFMTGSDFLDSLNSAYTKASPKLCARLTAVVYSGLLALLKLPKPKYSLLSDHLYSLKSQSNGKKESLLADLVTNTSILSRVQSTTGSDGSRARNTAASLSEFRNPSLARQRKATRTKSTKGKEPVVEDGNLHVHKMSLVSQIQDLFPDLGSAFVVKLLDEYGDNVELVTAHLLEDNLPPHLAGADRHQQIEESNKTQRPHFTPRSTPPPSRRNVHDDDEFDRLAVDMSRIHFGRKDRGTAEALLSDRGDAPNKARIIAALAAFDSDDDERDDTYDIEDVGGNVPGGNEEGDADPAFGNEEALFKALTSDATVFNRDATTRRSNARKALKEQTNMTDEALEGWATMINRDPKKRRKLESKYTAFTGQQRALAPSAYRGSPADSGAEGEDDAGATGHPTDRGRGGRLRGRGGGRGRGRGGGRGGTAGESGAGSTGDGGTGNPQVNRARKEANKSSRANHNRREQRARKMARGGLPG